MTFLMKCSRITRFRTHKFLILWKVAHLGIVLEQFWGRICQQLCRVYDWNAIERIDSSQKMFIWSDFCCFPNLTRLEMRISLNVD